MLPLLITWLLGAIPAVSTAAVMVPRQAQCTDSSLTATCPITMASYITVTVTATYIPPTVTIVVPDYTSIASSLSHASAIDSIVVVEQSQDRPISAPINTAIPTFVHTIVAPAFEATEAPTISNAPVHYVSATKNNSSLTQTASSDVVVGLTTVSIVPQPVNTSGPTTTIRSTIRLTSTVRGPFTSATAGWNGTNTNTTGVDALATSTSPVRLPLTSTVTTYVTTQTVTASTSITLSPVTQSDLSGGYGYPDSPQSWKWDQTDLEKRQTCVLVSAAFAGVWGTWCNNWDGHTTLPYTSWETTIDPGATLGASTSVSASATLQTSDGVHSHQASLSTPAAPSPTLCGELGPFTIGFDNLPAQSASNDTAGLPPIFNPFDHFYWSESWSYLPPPPAPYVPQSGSQLAISSPLNQDVANGSVSGFQIPQGGFGAGPRDHVNAYWFNAHWAFVGCQANVSDPSGTCDFVAQGYRYDADSGQSRVHVTQHFSQPLCTAARCQWQRIEFNTMFNALTTLRFQAKIGNQLRVFYTDSLGLGWWNNTCEAAAVRSSSRK